MARVTKRETYATESNSKILSQAKLNVGQEISTEQKSSEIQGFVLNQEEIKGAKDFAHAKKSDGQLQASVLKGQLNDLASRLDQFREGELKGLEKDAKKFGIADLGVIKDNLGKDIVRHEGPGIAQMYKQGNKYELPDRDPLNGLPKTQKMKNDAKTAPDMPFKNDDNWAKDDNLKGLLPNLFQQDGPGGKTPLESGLEKKAELKVPNAEKVNQAFQKAGVYNAMNKAKANQYVDPDQAGTMDVEKPKDPPPNSKDTLGHKVNPLYNDPIIDTENVDIKKVVAEHKGPDKTLIYTDPDQSQQKAKFDPTNPPRIKENELKNTGNPNDFNGVQWELPKSDGDRPHTDGEGGEGSDANIKKATTYGTGSQEKVQKFSGLTPTGAPGEGDDPDDPPGTNVPH